MTGVPTGGGAGRDLDVMIARLLTFGTYVSIALLVAGYLAMLAGGISPYAPAPGLDPGAIVADILAGRAPGFLWLGLLAVIATPTARIVAAMVGFARMREWEMASVSVGILVVITLSVILARLVEA